MEERVKCHECGSSEVRKGKKRFHKGIFLLVVIGMTMETNRSQEMEFVHDDCGHMWDVE